MGVPTTTAILIFRLIAAESDYGGEHLADDGESLTGPRP